MKHKLYAGGLTIGGMDEAQAVRWWVNNRRRYG